MILFLDFDGVMHPDRCVGCLDEPLFSRSAVLWSILRARPEIEVVFSTSWRIGYAVDELIDFATQGGGEDLARRFVSATPSVIREAGAYDTGKSPKRERECQLWMSGNGQLCRPWLALDDFAPFFSPDCPTLYLVDKRTGLTDADAEAIIARLKGQ